MANDNFLYADFENKTLTYAETVNDNFIYPPKPTQTIHIVNENNEELFHANVVNGELQCIRQNGESIDATAFECIYKPDEGFYEMQIKRDGSVLCKYCSGNEKITLYSQSGTVRCECCEDDYTAKWYDENGALIKSRALADNPYGEMSVKTCSYHPNGAIKSQTYQTANSKVHEEFDEAGNLIYIYDMPPGVSATEHHCFLDDCCITFSVVRFNDYEFLASGYIDEHSVRDLDEYDEYMAHMAEFDDDSISVEVEYFVTGNAEGVDAEPASEKQLEYLRSHDSCDVLSLSKRSFSLDIDRDYEDDFDYEE